MMAILSDDERDANAPAGTFFTTALENGNTLRLVFDPALGIVTSQEYDSDVIAIGTPVQLLDGFSDIDRVIGVEYFNDGSYLISLSDLTSSDQRWHFQNVHYRFDATGALIDTDTSIANQEGYVQDTETVDLSTGGHVEITTYESYISTGIMPGSVPLQSVFDADGSLISGGTKVNFEGFVNADSVHAAALEEGRYAIAWKLADGETLRTGMYVQVFNPDGSTYSDPVHLDSGETDGFMPDQVTLLSNGKFVVSDHYYSNAIGFVANEHIFNADGSLFKTIEGLHFNHLPSTRPTTAALSEGGFVSAWLEGYPNEDTGDIYVERFDAAGNAVGDTTHVADVDYIQGTIKVLALANDSWVVFWSGGSYATPGIFQQAFDSDGNAMGKPARIFNKAGETSLPQISALDDGRWTVTLDNGSSRTFHIDPDNHTPLIFDKTMTIDEDANVAVGWTGFDTYDSDGDAITGFEITDLQVNGSFTLNGKAVQVGDIITDDDMSALRYVPTSNLYGDAMLIFDVKAIDANGAKSVEAAHYVIDVTPLSDAPFGEDVHRTIYENGSYHFQQSDFAFSDVDGDSLKSIHLATKQQGAFFRDGTLVRASVLNIAYSEIEHYEWRPDKDYTREGAHPVHFTLVDSGKNEEHEQFNSSTNYAFDIDVLAVNQAPRGKNLYIHTLEDTTFKFSPAVFGFKDSDGNALKSIIIDDLPTDGELMLGKKHVVAGQEITAGNLSKLTWTPDDNDFGRSLGNFSIHLRDNGGTANGGTDISTSSYMVGFAIKDAPETINGTRKNDTLIGTKGDDIINGLAGSDKLNGGHGDNIMTGGAGRDTFAVMNGGEDIIMDFDHSGADHDRIDMRASKIFLVFGDIEQGLYQYGKDVQVNAYFEGHHESLLVKNTHVSDLTADMFIF